MALINQNSIIGVTSITSPSASNVLTFHTNDTTERLRVSTSGVSFSGTNASLDTSGNATFNGNVSIGGTLTYEDVTNIDAVGIITARDKIKLTSADGQIEATGATGLSINASGASAFTRFYTANTERLRINSNGVFDFKDNSFTNVGSIALDFIKGDADDNTNISFAGNDTITFKAGSTSPALTVNTTQVKVEDNQRFVAGTGNDLQIYHDGSVNRIRSDVLTIIEKNDSEDIASFMPDGAVVLFHNGSQKFETTSAGIKVSGSFPDITIHDTDTTNDNFRLLHNGGGTQLQVDPNNVGPNASHFIVGIDGTERLRIDHTGLVGIDVTNPTTNLDVNGKIQLRASGYETYATRIYSRLDSTHCSVIESYLNNSTAFEMMGSYADSGGANPRIVLGAGGQNVGVNLIDPHSNLHVYGPGDIRIGASQGGSTHIMQQVSYSSGYTGVHWMFESNDSVSWCFDGVLIVHGTGGSGYGSEVTHIKLVYSRESGALNSGDTWRNGSSQYNIDTLGHSQVGLNPGAGSLSYSNQTDPDGAGSTRSLFKLSWSASGQSVGVWSKLIGNFHYAAPSSGYVQIQDKDGNVKFNSRP